jgi:hypothetical protein
MDPEKFGLFDGWFDQVHIDEKWFFVTMKMLRVYLTEGEFGPVRRVQHKEHIEKVMFLSAIARPRYDENGTCIFDGKIGIWPFVKSVQALRSSVNRPAGTWETKCVKVTKEVYAAMVIDKVIPAIRAKWPEGNKTVYIQHDNASSHFKNDYVPFVTAGKELGRNISLTPQPANSPDTNVNDLGFFRALQARQWDSVVQATHDKYALIEAVTAAYDAFDPRLINFNFLTLSTCLEEIIKSHGDNLYKIPHIGKESLERLNQLPVRIAASEEAIDISHPFVDLDWEEYEVESDSESSDDDGEDYADDDDYANWFEDDSLGTVNEMDAGDDGDDGDDKKMMRRRILESWLF